MIRRIVLLVAVLAVPGASPLTAQQVSGEIRPRLEALAPDRSTIEGASSLRTRLAVTAETGALRLEVEAQNVHIPGADAGAFDLYQAYVALDLIAGATLTAGRQELAFGNERLVSRVDWSQYGQSFDGLLLSVDAGPALLQGFGMQTAEGSEGGITDAFFWGARASTPLFGGTLEAMVLTDDHTAFSTSETTFGGSYAGDLSFVGYVVEAWRQTGARYGADVGTWMAAGRVSGQVHDRVQIRLGYDRLAEGFNTFYGTAHAFAGDADLFPHTPVRGLEDRMLGVAVAVMDGVMLEADYHRFSAVETAGLSSWDYADEIDVRVRQAVLTNLSVLAGASWVLAADSDVAISEGDHATGYLMGTATF